ncbi:MAG: MFS transporter, partial [Candidatus Hermodarchaeota archaeon]
MNSERRILEKDLISKKTKYAFGTGEMFHVIILSVAFSTITFYYNVKLGLSEQLIGFAWLIFAFWNAINDPLFGLIQDRTKTRWGRRIPYIRFGAPIYGLLFILIWFPLVDVNNEILLFLNLIFILFAFDSIYTIIGLVMYSMPAEMVVTSNARANLMVYVSIFGSLGTLIAIIIPLFLLTGDNTSAAVNPIFLITMISLGIIGTVILVIMSFYLKENIYTQLEEPLGFFDGI